MRSIYVMFFGIFQVMHVVFPRPVKDNSPGGFFITCWWIFHGFLYSVDSVMRRCILQLLYRCCKIGLLPMSVAFRNLLPGWFRLGQCCTYVRRVNLSWNLGTSCRIPAQRDSGIAVGEYLLWETMDCGPRYGIKSGSWTCLVPTVGYFKSGRFQFCQSSGKGTEYAATRFTRPSSSINNW